MDQFFPQLHDGDTGIIILWMVKCLLDVYYEVCTFLLFHDFVLVNIINSNSLILKDKMCFLIFQKYNMFMMLLNSVCWNDTDANISR